MRGRSRVGDRARVAHDVETTSLACSRRYLWDYVWTRNVVTLLTYYLAFGTVLASYTIADFSLAGLKSTDRDQIDDRWHEFKSAMTF